MAETLLQKAQRLNMQPAQQPTEQPKESLIQKAQRLGIQPEPKKKSVFGRVGKFVGGVAKAVAEPVVTLAARPFQLAEELLKPGEQTAEELAINVPGIGRMKFRHIKDHLTISNLE